VISCDQFLAELGDYLEGEVAAEIRQQLEGHLAHCATCQVLVDSARKTLQIVTESGSFDLPVSVSEPIVETIMAKIRAGRGERRSKERGN
jgi:anti-sigma factor RsiW